MIDKRLEKLAYILINHSLKIKKKDLFLIVGGNAATPLIKEVYKQALEVGAHPYAQIGVDGLAELFYKNANEKQLKYMSPIAKFEIENIDAKLGIICPENTRNLTNVDPKKQAARVGGTVGTKKRMEIAKKAAELEIRLLNVKV